MKLYILLTVLVLASATADKKKTAGKTEAVNTRGYSGRPQSTAGFTHSQVFGNTAGVHGGSVHGAGVHGVGAHGVGAHGVGVHGGVAGGYQQGVNPAFPHQAGFVQGGQGFVNRPVAGNQGFVQRPVGAGAFGQQGYGQQGFVQGGVGVGHQGFVQGGVGQQGFVQGGLGQQGFVQGGLGQQGFVQGGLGQQGFVQGGVGVGHQGFVQQGGYGQAGALGNVHNAAVQQFQCTKSSSLAQYGISQNCKDFCKEPISNAYVCCDQRPGQCPEIRKTCPRYGPGNQPPACCFVDSQCQGPTEKCCFDKCLNHKVCKKSEKY